MTDLREHDVGTALLTYNSAVPDTIPPLFSQRMGKVRRGGGERVGAERTTELCPCHSDLILGSFPGPTHIYRSEMDQHGPEEAASGLLANRLLDSTLASISPPAIWVREFRGDPVIAPHQFVIAVQMSFTDTYICLH